MNKVIFKDLGLIDYKECWDFQRSLMEESIKIKQHNRKLDKEKLEQTPQKHYLLFCEHPAVYTLGRRTKAENLLLNENDLKARGLNAYKINRGGDITFHGEGQLVGYPILDLDCFFTDIHKYVRYLEEAIIRTLAEYGIEAKRIKDYTGVWLEKEEDDTPRKKICAIGVHLSRWVTMHGFALNVNTDLSYFEHIIPCGISEKDKTVTSLQQELGKMVDMQELKEKLKLHLSTLFEFEFANEVPRN